MGQYFIAHNIDRNEFLGFGMLKFVERLSNQAWTAALAYLLFEGPQDGTVLTRMHHDDYLSLSDEELLDYADDLYSPDLHKKKLKNAETKEQREDAIMSIAALTEANKTISVANRYAGRWAGDRVTIVGDYADSKRYHKDGTDVSEGVIEEMAENNVFEWLDADRPEVRR